MTRVLIPETLQRNVLEAIRLLGQAGYDIAVAFPTQTDKWKLRTLFKSRYVRQTTYIHSPATNPNAYIQDLLKLVSSGEYNVLLPFTHTSVLPISYNKQQLAEYVRIPIADYSVVEQAHDKLTTVKLAQKIGVPTPVTFHPKDRDEFEWMRDEFVFPCLVKARQGSGVGKTIRFATNFDELLAGYQEIDRQPSFPPVNDFSLPIIQEYVPGQIHDAVFLYANGTCKAGLTQERVIMYPVQGGVGAVNRTTNDPTLFDYGKRLLDALGWHGPAQVEFRLDPRDGQYKLMEINPKFWGTLPLSIAAGMDFTKMACQLAVDGDVEPQFDYQVGLTYRWLFSGELYALRQEFSLSRLKQFLRDFSKPNTRYDWTIKDPLPDLFLAGVTLARTTVLARKWILPEHQDLNRLALERPPAQQPDWGVSPSSINN